MSQPKTCTHCGADFDFAFAARPRIWPDSYADGQVTVQANCACGATYATRASADGLLADKARRDERQAEPEPDYMALARAAMGRAA